MAETLSYLCYQCNNSSFPVSPPESPRYRITDFQTSYLSYNPVIFMRIPPQTVLADDINGDVISFGSDVNGERLFRLFYNDPAGTGLQPLPPSMTEFLLGIGIERLLDRLEIINPDDKKAASKAAIELMKIVEIKPSHVRAELDCAVCHEDFVIGSVASEMPCKHKYHSDCIMTWLSIKNSCPICRHELPMNEDINNGMTIWRSVDGGYSLGRYSGRNAVPRNIVMDFPTEERRRSGGMRRMFGGFASFCKRVVSGLASRASVSSSEAGSSENLISARRSM